MFFFSNNSEEMWLVDVSQQGENNKLCIPISSGNATERMLLERILNAEGDLQF